MSRSHYLGEGKLLGKRKFFNPGTGRTDCFQKLVKNMQSSDLKKREPAVLIGV